MIAVYSNTVSEWQKLKESLYIMNYINKICLINITGLFDSWYILSGHWHGIINFRVWEKRYNYNVQSTVPHFLKKYNLLE